MLKGCPIHHTSRTELFHTQEEEEEDDEEGGITKDLDQFFPQPLLQKGHFRFHGEIAGLNWVRGCGTLQAVFPSQSSAGATVRRAVCTVLYSIGVLFSGGC